MIETTITKIQYDADGVQRRWSIPFPYADVKHISIYTKVGEEPTVKVVDNYDIDKDDAVVIYPTVASGQEPLASGTKITIARETPETQLEDASQVHFTSKDVERGLDKLTMITQELSTTSGETMEVSAAAFEAAEEAVDSAAQANKTAEEAKTIAGQAVGIAEDAKSIAQGIDAKATEALTNSNTAVNTANSAKQTAEGIDGKATQALANSTEALTKATEAKNTADSYQGQITTLRNDVDDLGDQVAAIEGKIPAEATTANQLADKEFVTTITDELAADITALNADIQQINLIKWVQALPATGETKYLYAIPRNEVDKDGKKIVALYLWDGTEWRGAGGTSIDPGISEGDGIKGDYCTTYGIIDAPNGILTNPSGMEVVLKQGVVLQLAGQDIKTTISGDMAYTITSTADCDLFYVSGTTSLMEVAQIVWSRIEPDNGQTGVLAWWNPDNKKWKFKSNDTGNVWAEAVATPIVHIHTNGTTITRIDHIGYRILDDEVFNGFDFEGTKAEFDTAVAAGTITDNSVSIITDDVGGDTVATKADLAVVENNSNNLTNITSAGRSTISNVGFPSARFEELTLGVSGTTYTAPANGYFCLNGKPGVNANFAISFYNQTANLRQCILGNNYADWISTYIPAKKGDVVTLLHNNVTKDTHSFLFIYAEGNK